MTEHSRKRLTAAAKELMDISVGQLVRLRGHKGTGCVQAIDETAKWARVRWMNGDRSGELTDHPFASLRKSERAGGHNLDARAL